MAHTVDDHHTVTNHHKVAGLVRHLTGIQPEEKQGEFVVAKASSASGDTESQPAIKLEQIFPGGFLGITILAAPSGRIQIFHPHSDTPDQPHQTYELAGGDKLSTVQQAIETLALDTAKRSRNGQLELRSEAAPAAAEDGEAPGPGARTARASGPVARVAQAMLGFVGFSARPPVPKLAPSNAAAQPALTTAEEELTQDAAPEVVAEFKDGEATIHNADGTATTIELSEREAIMEALEAAFSAPEMDAAEENGGEPEFAMSRSGRSRKAAPPRAPSASKPSHGGPQLGPVNAQAYNLMLSLAQDHGASVTISRSASGQPSLFAAMMGTEETKTPISMLIEDGNMSIIFGNAAGVIPMEAIQEALPGAAATPDALMGMALEDGYALKGEWLGDLDYSAAFGERGFTIGGEEVSPNKDALAKAAAEAAERQAALDAEAQKAAEEKEKRAADASGEHHTNPGAEEANAVEGAGLEAPEGADGSSAEAAA